MKTLIAGETAGDPMSQRKWLRCSLKQLSRRLRQISYQICPMTVRRLLKQQGYRLKANVKRFTGLTHPDRDQQFKYIQTQTQAFLKGGLPVISVDTKKKELIGNFKNPECMLYIWNGTVLALIGITLSNLVV